MQAAAAVLKGARTRLLPASSGPSLPPPPPLALTLTAVGLLVLLPALLLWHWPRPRAQGLDQLMASSSLLQSFPATPDRPVPLLWQERLGPKLAESLWRQQRLTWWQLWDSHAEGAPYLALPLAGWPGGSRAALPPGALRVGDLVVVAADPLSRSLLADQIRPQQRPSRGLGRRCLERLQRQQSVFWNPTALAVIVGPVAPLLQRFQEGCLVLDLEGLGLRWQGEAAAVDGVLLPAPAAGLLDPRGGAPSPLPADLLLDLRGSSLDLLLHGLLSRQLIREPLTARYGFDPQRLELLRRTPFHLRLRPREKGQFQASLELQLSVGNQRRTWEKLLTALAESLRQQGLRTASEASAAAGGSSTRAAAADSPASPPANPPPTPPLPAVPSARPPAPPAAAVGRPGSAAKVLPPAEGATWIRSDDVVVGGWRWVGRGAGPAELLFFLGPVPPTPPAATQASEDAPLAAGALRFQARPQDLDRLGLLPVDMPVPVRRSSQMWIRTDPLNPSAPKDPLSRVTGGLQVSR